MIDEDRLYAVVGERIRNLRAEQSGVREKMTQAELAQRVGLERTSITNIEKGTQKLPLHMLFRFCEELKVPVVELLPSIHEVQRAKVEPQLEDVQVGDRFVKVPPLVKQFINSISTSSNEPTHSSFD